MRQPQPLLVTSTTDFSETDTGACARACRFPGSGEQTRYPSATVIDPEEPFGPARPDARDRRRRIASAVAAPLAALLVPDRGVPRLVAAGRFRLAMAIAVVAALLAAGAAAVRIDVAPAVRAENSGAPPPPAAPGTAPAAGSGAGSREQAEVKTDREIDEEIAKRTAVVQVKLGLAAALGTPARILLLGVVLFLLGRYVGGKPTFQRALAAASVGALPWAVRSLIAAAATWRQTAIAPADLGGLVAGGLPIGADHPLLARLIAGVDLFSLWSVLLCGLGLAAAAGIGRLRGTIAVVIGFALFLLISTVGAR